MSNILWKSFSLCFSKFKCFPTVTFSQPPTDISDEQPPLFNNFNSLYDITYSHNINSTSSSTTAAAAITTAGDSFFTSSEEDSDSDSVPDFTSAFASHRFFFSSPGSSNSIFEPLEPQPPPMDFGAAVSGGVPVEKYSPDPFSDFRKSMVEMIEARDPTDIKADWEFLHELLLCYLALNPKHTHKFIVGAFADVVVSLMSPQPQPPANDACRKSCIRQPSATSHLSI